MNIPKNANGRLLSCTDLFAGFDPDEHELLTMDGYDDCIVGIVERFGQPPIVCYDKAKVLEKLVADGCSEEDADEWWSYNQIGAWVGESTPCFYQRTSKATHPPPAANFRRNPKRLPTLPTLPIRIRNGRRAAVYQLVVLLHYRNHFLCH